MEPPDDIRMCFNCRGMGVFRLPSTITDLATGDCFEIAVSEPCAACWGRGYVEIDRDTFHPSTQVIREPSAAPR